MYNKEIKERYLNTIENKNVALNGFQRSQLIENMLNKDLCNFSEKEIDEMLLMIDTPSVHLLNSIMSSYRTYTDWAITNNLVDDGINHYRNVSVEDLWKYVNKFWMEEKVLSHQSFEKIMESLESPDLKFIFGCLWHGICGPSQIEIGLIESKDFDWENTAIHVHRLDEDGNRIYNRTVEVDKKLLEIGKEASEMEYEEAIGPKGNIVKYPLLGKTVIKSRTREDSKFSAHNIYHRIYRKIDNIKRMFDTPLITPKSIKMSGMIHKLKELGCDIENLEKADGFMKIIDNYGEKYNPNNKAAFKRKIKSYW